MAFEIRVSNLQRSSFRSYDRLISKFKPSIVSALALDSTIIFHNMKESSYLEFMIKDSTGRAFIKLIGDIQVIGDAPEVALFSISSEKLCFIFNNYSDDIDLIMTLGNNGATSFVSITTPTDTIMLPTLFMEYEEIISSIYSFSFQEVKGTYSGTNENVDLISSMLSCMPYIGNDDRKNNSIALYPDYVITNDRRHIYIKNLKDPTFLADQLGSITSVPGVLIHKNVIKVFETIRKNAYQWCIDTDRALAIFYNDDLYCEINNNMSNLKPPSEEILNMIKSPKITTTVPAKVLNSILTMFSGFNDIKSDWHPIVITTLEDGLEFSIKNTGDNQSYTCSVTRKLICETNPENIGVCETIISDSLLSFLAPINDSDELITIYDAADSKAFTLVTTERTVYLSKLEE